MMTVYGEPGGIAISAMPRPFLRRHPRPTLTARIPFHSLDRRQIHGQSQKWEVHHGLRRYPGLRTHIIRRNYTFPFACLTTDRSRLPNTTRSKRTFSSLPSSPAFYRVCHTEMNPSSWVDVIGIGSGSYILMTRTDATPVPPCGQRSRATSHHLHKILLLCDTVHPTMGVFQAHVFLAHTPGHADVRV
ncbi:hypothetical protein EDC04DRAFT_112353 [Pisolithus marmoratus]|nr:hypothetical protein EDC04DRAFT_112353 [Pisolithus marmoratus]